MIPVPVNSSRPERISHCSWCDSRDQSRRADCTLFAEALETGNIPINEIGHVFTSSGTEIHPAFGRGGMKLLYDAVYPVKPAVSQGFNVRLSTYENGIAAL